MPLIKNNPIKFNLMDISTSYQSNHQKINKKYFTFVRYNLTKMYVYK